MDKIVTTDLFDKYEWLDPSYPSPVTFQIPYVGTFEFPSAQNAYQAAKCPQMARQISEMIPRAAHLAGNSERRGGNWTEMKKKKIMLEINRRKFTQNRDLYWKLLSLRDPKTGFDGIPIVAELASRHGMDEPFGTYWGTVKSTKNPFLNVPTPECRNELGNILMSVRSELLQHHKKWTLQDALRNTFDENVPAIYINILGSVESLYFGRDFHERSNDLNRIYHGIFDRFPAQSTYVLRITPVMSKPEPGRYGEFIGLELTVV